MSPAERVAGPPIIDVEQLVKRYGKTTAVDSLSFSVKRGEIFGLLGPNGAGKTTTLSILQGLRRADSGRASVLGLPIDRERERVQRTIGVQLQSTSLLPDLTAAEQVILFARLYGRRLNHEGAVALLDQVGLGERGGALPDTLSGGQRQRLALALALVNDPELLFLDEPTAGLDPQSRRRLWEVVRGLSEAGRTVVMTTHYMDEAEALCHRVGIIDHGKMLAIDSPGALVNGLGGSAVVTTALPRPHAEMAALPGVQSMESDAGRVQLQTDDVPATISALAAIAQRYNLSLHDLHVRQPTLEDLFLHLTGRSIRA